MTLNWLLILTSFGGDVQMMHVTKEQCLAAVNYYSLPNSPRIAPETRAEVIKQRREANDRRIVAKQVNRFMKAAADLRKRAKGLK
jgi:hypothetical protein